MSSTSTDCLMNSQDNALFRKTKDRAIREKLIEKKIIALTQR